MSNPYEDRDNDNRGPEIVTEFVVVIHKTYKIVVPGDMDAGYDTLDAYGIKDFEKNGKLQREEIEEIVWNKTFKDGLPPPGPIRRTLFSNPEVK